MVAVFRCGCVAVLVSSVLAKSPESKYSAEADRMETKYNKASKFVPAEYQHFSQGKSKYSAEADKMETKYNKASKFVPAEYQHFSQGNYSNGVEDSNYTAEAKQMETKYKPSEASKFEKKFIPSFVRNENYTGLMLVENATGTSNESAAEAARDKEEQQHFQSKYEPQEYQNVSGADLAKHYKSEYVPKDYQPFLTNESNKSAAEMAKKYRSEYEPKEYQDFDTNESNVSKAEMAKKYQSEYVPKDFLHFISEEKDKRNSSEDSNSSAVEDSSKSLVVQLAATNPASTNFILGMIVSLSVPAAIVMARRRKAAQTEGLVHQDEPQSQFHLLA